MRRVLDCLPRDRRQAQAGDTLVELLVAVTIMGFALVLIVGTFSTGLLQASLAKRNTAATAVVQYELDQISGELFNASAQPYSDCFATEDASSPPVGVALGGSCPSTFYTIRVDVSPTNLSSSTQLWTVTVFSVPNIGRVGNQVQIYKVNR